MTAVVVAAIVIGLPAAAFTLWPLLRRGGRAVLPLPPDTRGELSEHKRAMLRGLRELEFEHGAGHVSDDDYADLRARYEAETARILGELDRLGPEEPERGRAAPEPRRATARPSAWHHPGALATAGVLLVVFGVALGVGIVRYTAPDAGAGMPAPGTRPLADLGTGAATGGTLAPGMLQGMLAAAREALFAERYGDAIAAYQAILKRDPRNVEAMTYLGLIVAVGDHADAALETFDRALAIEPNYPPALLYRGQVLYEAKRDVKGAISAWEQFLAVAPPGEDRERVTKLLAEARRRTATPRP